MGTSRLSSKMQSIYKSLICQFDRLFKLNRKPENLQDLHEAKNYLFNMLNEQCLKKQKIVIILDSIDQLSQNDHDLNWMPYELPKNVKIVCSILDSHRNILDDLKSKLVVSDKTNHLEVIDIKFEKAIDQLKKRLFNEKRDIQQFQWTVIEDCLKITQKITPLHVKLLFDICVEWKSSFIPKPLSNCTTTLNTINFLFNKYQMKYGKITLSHFIFYLTIFKNGVSQNELEDILSIDDKVLDEVFEKHEPPIRRFPSSILVRLLDELKEYLTYKEADDTLVVCWFHRTFYEAAKDYYGDLLNKSEIRDELLQNIIDYFNETWKENPKEYKFNGEKKLAIRFTKSQKMKIESSKNKGLIIHNKRKLNELLNIVMMFNDYKKKIDYLIDLIYFNYQFIHSKAELKDLDFIHEAHNQIELICDDLKLDEIYREKVLQLVEISKVYRNNYGTIITYPDSIIYEVFSKIKNDNYTLKIQKTIMNEKALVPTKTGFMLVNNEKILYTRDETVIKFHAYWVYNSPYVILLCVSKGLNKIKIFNEINGQLSKGILEIEDNIPTRWYHTNIYLNKNLENHIFNIKNIDGGVVYLVYDNDKKCDIINIKTFNNNMFKLKTSKKKLIRKIFLISLNALVILYDTSFEIINFLIENNNTVNTNQCFISHEFENEIISIKSNMIESSVFNNIDLGSRLINSIYNQVFVPEFDLIYYSILCVIFKDKILIYKYNKIKNQVVNGTYLTNISLGYELYHEKQLFVDYLDYNIGCFIDRSFSIKSILDNNQLIEMNNSSLVFKIIAFKITKPSNDWNFMYYDLKLDIIDNNSNNLTLIKVFIDEKTNEVYHEIIDLIKYDHVKVFSNLNHQAKIYDFFDDKIIMSLNYEKSILIYDTSN